MLSGPVNRVMDLSVVVSDPQKLMEFITGSEDNLTTVASHDNFKLVVLGMMKSLLISNKRLELSSEKVLELNERCSELTDRCVTLEAAVDTLEQAAIVRDQRIDALENEFMKKACYTNDLSTRAMDLEEYSRRNTCTLTNIPYVEGENLIVKVCQMINKLGVLSDGIDPSYISHVHRNMRYGTKPKDGGLPPTITLVFVRSMDKDLIMNNKSVWKEKHGKGKGSPNILHSMAPTVYREKKLIEAVPEVEYVDYRGHLKHFAVKMVNSTLHKFIRSRFHLKSEHGV